MESEKVKVTLLTSRYYGQYGVIKKVTQKKYKIRFWDTGEETYLLQTSVHVLEKGANESDGKQGRDEGEGYQKKGKKAKVKRGVNQAVNEMLESYDDDITREEWEDIVDKIGKMFI
jgi:hypothetical protein